MKPGAASVASGWASSPAAVSGVGSMTGVAVRGTGVGTAVGSGIAAGSVGLPPHPDKSKMVSAKPIIGGNNFLVLILLFLSLFVIPQPEDATHLLYTDSGSLSGERLRKFPKTSLQAKLPLLFSQFGGKFIFLNFRSLLLARNILFKEV
jgi:hypothetical protein